MTTLLNTISIGDFVIERCKRKQIEAMIQAKKEKLGDDQSLPSDHPLYKDLNETREFFLRSNGVFENVANAQGYLEAVPIEVENPERMNCWINVYMIDRCFGGHEEGGWWYDVAACQVSVPVIPDEGMNFWEYVEKELAKYKKYYTNDGRRPISSVLSEGQYDVRFEFDKAESDTSGHRPHYC